jgi:4-hydroxy-3-methylbut-2-enyl diphosphate reductase
MQRYTEQGVLCEDNPAAIAAGDRVLIRAHGIPREEEALLRNTGAVLVDATCPKVKKAQLAIARASAEGGVLLLFGEKTHPEVQGLLSYAENPALVFGDLPELEALPLDPSTHYFLAAQTTQDRSLYQRAGRRLAEKLGKEVRTLDTICDATRDRQQEVLSLCAKVQAMVVVGGFNSGNTRRLAKVARSRGIPTVHVEQISDITPEILDQVLGRVCVVGLTAGASTPDEHIDAMRVYLEDLPPRPGTIFR